MASHGVPRATAAVDKSEQARERERKQIERYKQLENDVTVRIKDKDYSADTLHLTSALLTQNPEYYTIWNWRRLLLLDVFNRELSENNSSPPPTTEPPTSTTAPTTPAQHELNLLLTEDLTFLLPLLKQFPKCYWIWNHRSWLLQTATTHLPLPTSLQLWQQELKLVNKMLDLDARNFHGWGYRREVVGNIETLMQRQWRGQDGQGETSHDEENKTAPTMTEQEFTYTTTKIEANLSNFSAWHYRSQLLPKLLAERARKSTRQTPDPQNNPTKLHRSRDLLRAETDLLTRALYTDPYDQSLWSYFSFITSVLADDREAKSSPEALLPLDHADRLAFLQELLAMLRELREDAEDCKFVLLALLEVGGVLGRVEGVEHGRGEVESGGKAEMGLWVAGLRELDPLRDGRWRDLGSRLGV
ncbi:hypothetical protein MBLNU230_g8489t1 [Neophaeotheca triangularis]